MRAPTRVSDVQTRAEAFEFLKAAFEEQLETSIAQNAEPNQETPGDARARQAFGLLLQPAEQRTFFQLLIRDQRYWPRIKTLVGNPPYSFLLPQDEGLLRAGGICRNRAHLAPVDSSVSKAGDFGTGHFHDAFGRMYRLIANQSSTTQLPWKALVAQSKVMLDVRLKGRTRKSKDAILRGRDTNEMHTLAFPRPGDELRLQLVPFLQGTASDEHAENDTSVRIRVEKGYQKAKQSPIARLVVTVLG
jgi:hypothetical protein